MSKPQTLQTSVDNLITSGQLKPWYQASLKAQTGGRLFAQKTAQQKIAEAIKNFVNIPSPANYQSLITAIIEFFPASHKKYGEQLPPAIQDVKNQFLSLIAQCDKPTLWHTCIEICIKILSPAPGDSVPEELTPIVGMLKNMQSSANPADNAIKLYDILNKISPSDDWPPSYQDAIQQIKEMMQAIEPKLLATQYQTGHRENLSDY